MKVLSEKLVPVLVLSATLWISAQPQLTRSQLLSVGTSRWDSVAEDGLASTPSTAELRNPL